MVTLEEYSVVWVIILLIEFPFHVRLFFMCSFFMFS